MAVNKYYSMILFLYLILHNLQETIVQASTTSQPISTTQLVTNPITTTQLVTNPITTTQLVTNPITTTQLMTNPITTSIVTTAASVKPSAPLSVAASTAMPETFPNSQAGTNNIVTSTLLIGTSKTTVKSDADRIVLLFGEQSTIIMMLSLAFFKLIGSILF